MIPMLSKELKELARSYKLLFVPLAFAILGLGQPVAFKLMPTLLKSASNLPPGAVIEIPTPPPGEVVASALGQFSQMGILLLVLVAMGAIAGERATGVAATVLTKPVGRGEYLAAKFASYGLLAFASVGLGMAVTAYYTQVLIGPVDWVAVGAATLLYLPNMLLVAGVTLCLSAFMPSPVAAGGAGLVAVILLNMVPKYMGKFLAGISPGALAESAAKALAGAEYAVTKPVAGVLAMTLAALLIGYAALRRQEI